MASVAHSLRWHNDHRVIVRDFGSGEREVIVQRLDTHVGGPAPVTCPMRKARPDGDDDGRRDERNRERAARRARSTIRQKVKMIGADRLLTLTYTDNVTDRDRVVRDFDRFRRRIRKVAGFRYVGVLENQKRGAFHVHLAVRGRVNVALVRSIWRSVIGLASDGRPGGNIDVAPFWRRHQTRRGPGAFRRPNLHRLASYLAKYVGKDLGVDASGQRRVWCSQGIGVPETVVHWFRDRSWEEVCAFAASELGVGGQETVGWYSRRSETLFLATSNRI